MNLIKLHIFWRWPGLSGRTQRPQKSPLKSYYFAVKPLSDSILFITAVRHAKRTLNQQKSRKKEGKFPNTI